MPNPDLIGSKEACSILDRDRSSLTRYVQEGRLVAVSKLPGRNGAFVFDRAAVEAFKATLTDAPSDANEPVSA